MNSKVHAGGVDLISVTSRMNREEVSRAYRENLGSAYPSAPLFRLDIWHLIITLIYFRPGYCGATFNGKYIWVSLYCVRGITA